MPRTGAVKFVSEKCTINYIVLLTTHGVIIIIIIMIAKAGQQINNNALYNIIL